MAGKKKPKALKQAADPNRTITENRKARYKFAVLDTLECGIVLVGSEVKSLREGNVSLAEAYARVREGEVWLMGCDISVYAQASHWNHDPRRPRKLLLQQRQIHKFANQAQERGLTLVPLKLYFNERGIAKVLIGLCRGKKLHDKREAIKQADVKRSLQRTMRGR